jgi:hypothetical protein
MTGKAPKVITAVPKVFTAALGGITAAEAAATEAAGAGATEAAGAAATEAAATETSGFDQAVQLRVSVFEAPIVVVVYSLTAYASVEEVGLTPSRKPGEALLADAREWRRTCSS